MFVFYVFSFFLMASICLIINIMAYFFNELSVFPVLIDEIP